MDDPDKEDLGGAQVFLEDLTTLADDEIARDNTVSQSRLTYAVSLRRLTAFLRKAPASFDQADKQARLALAYIRHAEGANLTTLHLGPTAQDERLVEQVAEMRREIGQLSEKRAQVLLMEGRSRRAPKVIPVAVAVKRDDEANRG